MANTIDTAFIKQFESDVHMAYQRMGSKLRNTVRLVGNVAGNVVRFQKIGTGSASTKSRNGMVTPMELTHTTVEATMSDLLEQLADVLEARKQADPETSYVASLHAKGLNKILEKVGEECTETLLAAKDAEHSGETRELVCETADLWFHSMVMLSHLGTDADAVLAELERRFDSSGLTEKAQRHQNK